METILCKDSSHAAHALHDWLENAVRTTQAKSVFLPAGNTPIPIYRYWEKVRPSFLNGLKFVQVDDVLGSVGKDYFKNFFLEHLPSYRDQFVWIEGESGSGEGAELAILGLGLNGHVAFHEPSVPSGFTFGCVALDQGTCESLKIPFGTWGITHGLGHFLKAKKIAIIATGKSKSEMVAKVLAGDKSIPAGWMLDHGDFTLIADEAALGNGVRDIHVTRSEAPSMDGKLF
jgi:6-phosphogluconolactonase/glucosamine-6-phosphate isomerase/deaminase